jgi:hypothetical protein
VKCEKCEYWDKEEPHVNPMGECLCKSPRMIVTPTGGLKTVFPRVHKSHRACGEFKALKEGKNVE